VENYLLKRIEKKKGDVKFLLSPFTQGIKKKVKGRPPFSGEKRKKDKGGDSYNHLIIPLDKKGGREREGKKGEGKSSLSLEAGSKQEEEERKA